MVMKKKKKKPKFNVLNLGFHKRVKARWRKPRGTHNKKRMKKKWAGALPNIGYRNPKAIRDLHPNGHKEVRVHNVAGLEGLKDVLVRIAAAVGARKREEIEKKAKAMKLKIANVKKKKAKKKR
jgi:large subunit ribosomal protein L32e